MEEKIGNVLVVGAGIGGIRSAVDLAEEGFSVTLIDRSAHFGGILRQLDRQFSSNRCGMCRMLPMVQRDAGGQFCLRKGLFHENIEILMNTELSGIDGEPGRFDVSLRQQHNAVDPRRCVGCGLCAEACPVTEPDPFNEGMSTRKAIYLPVPHAIPNTYLIDPAACTRCGACVEVCPVDAVRLEEDGRKSFRILVVDDELIVRQSLQAWLEDEGFFVQTAGDGDEALKMLEEKPWHLMLSDIKMPGMDGVVLLEKALTMQPELSVVMMTAYATVETAVDALKLGAKDYLVKPFDPEALMPKVDKYYETLESSRDRRMSVGAVILSIGTEYFNPGSGINAYEFGKNPHVVTSLQFERMISGTGPSSGRFIRPHDQKQVKKIAWFQCVGSRDLQTGADFCASICCMVSLKEALLAREKAGSDLDTAIFYMDMRTAGKGYERYRQRVEKEAGVRLIRSRVHSLTSHAPTGDPLVRYVVSDGTEQEEIFDLVVLAVGQRPASATAGLAERLGLPLNPWGFVAEDPFFPARTVRPGIFVGGAFTGPRDIAESVVSASSAAAEASLVLHSVGLQAVSAEKNRIPYRDVSTQTTRILVAVCGCGKEAGPIVDPEKLTKCLKEDPSIIDVAFLSSVCTEEGWGKLAETAVKSLANRVVIGACHPYLFLRRIKRLAGEIGLDPALMEVVDIMSPWMDSMPGYGSSLAEGSPAGGLLHRRLAVLRGAVARVRYADPVRLPETRVCQRALVVGGGIAGMTAALTIADHGCPVHLVEQSDVLGGNLRWLQQNLEGQRFRPLLEDTLKRVEGHAGITVHFGSHVAGSNGSMGAFVSTVEDARGRVSVIEHGVTVLAVGGKEAVPSEYGYGRSGAVVTQQALETDLAAGKLNPSTLTSVVMIQCVGSRREPRNYCSRVCCPTSLKHARMLKDGNPDLSVFILYRDMMSCGFSEAHFTRARGSGVTFIPYDPADPPAVSVGDDKAEEGAPVSILVNDPISGKRLSIGADLLVLATGIVPRLSDTLAANFGLARTEDGFVAEADTKWRPVDGAVDGVFACGIALNPGTAAASIASAQAAAQRGLRILSHERLAASRFTAVVRHSLCSLCLCCIDHCPYAARAVDTENQRIVVYPERCQGCGACAAVCPNDAAVVSGMTARRMFEEIDAAVEAPAGCARPEWNDSHR